MFRFSEAVAQGKAEGKHIGWDYLDTQTLNNWYELILTQFWPEPGWTCSAVHAWKRVHVSACLCIAFTNLWSNAFTVTPKKRWTCGFVSAQHTQGRRKEGSAVIFKSSWRAPRMKYLSRRSLDLPMLAKHGSHWFLTKQLGHHYNKMHYGWPHMPWHFHQLEPHNCLCPLSLFMLLYEYLVQISICKSLHSEYVFCISVTDQSNMEENLNKKKSRTW